MATAARVIAIAEKLSERWCQPIVVENRAGAGRNIGVEAVAMEVLHVPRKGGRPAVVDPVAGNVDAVLTVTGLRQKDASVWVDKARDRWGAVIRASRIRLE